MSFCNKNKSLCQKIILAITFLSLFVFFSCLSLWRFNSGQVFYYDFGHFARIIWLISRFSEPVINHKVLGDIHFLGDHFSPSIYLLSPLFWVANKLHVLLIEQVLATVIAGIIMFKLARKEKLNFIASFSICLVFFMFAGLENPLVTDWHSESTAVVFLLLFVYLFFYTKRQFLALISALVFIGFKDSNSISLIFILIPYFLKSKNNRKSILILIVFSLFWFIFVGYLITPMIAKQAYLYAPVLPTNPVSYLTNYFNTPIKRSLIIDSFGSFAFAPLFSGVFLLPIVAELGIRLIPTYMHSQSFTLGMHYNVFLASFLALATIQTFKHVRSRMGCDTNKKTYLFIFMFLIFSLLYAKKITHPPILMAVNPTFWKEWNNKSELFNQLKLIPQSGSVMSQNNILPHLVARKEKIYLLSFEYKKLKPDYVVLDLSPGQNPNNYYSGEINNRDQVIKLKELLLKDPSYQRIITSYEYLFLLKRVSSE